MRRFALTDVYWERFLAEILHRAGLLLFILTIFDVASLAQTITTYAGPPLPVSGRPATTQAIDHPLSVAFDNAGGFYVGSGSQNRVYRVTADGTLTLVAGSGTFGGSGDGGPATLAQLGAPLGLAVDPAGNLYISAGCHIRKVSNGVITTVVGTGTCRYSGDGGPATAAEVNRCRGNGSGCTGQPLHCRYEQQPYPQSNA